ncbi:mitochondrial amidoxime reducing component 2 [Patella vulgata]|uniref:mitochondrial amidoxime reducing component 2 n=1 Tax=Patella vulgata TaxID=6465 RepID=UPI00217F60D4|nr:mitochondrial amidoxime reducing component 2 [Patella vulgata]
MPFGFTDDPASIIATLAISSALKYTFNIASWLSKKKQYELVGHITHINSYPIKACGGIALKTADATSLGIRVNGFYDRHWLVTKENGDFLTARQYPQLIVVSTRYTDDNLVITAPGMTELTVPLHPSTDRSKVVNCRVWNNHLEGQDCGQEASRWFSQYLMVDGIRLLVSTPELMKSQANSRKNAWGNIALPGDQGGYQDECCGFLIMNQASVTELNNHLKNPVTYRNFRPNIVIDGKTSFEEDNWKELLIGKKVNIRMLEPCTRCLVTTVDPEKGVKSEDGEPLKTLSTIRCYKKYGKSPLLGMLGTADEPGRISLGDPVYAIRK